MIEISKSNLVKAYRNANIEGKKLLTDLFGNTVISENVIDRIQSFEDACAELGYDPDAIRPYRCPKTKDEEALNAVREIWVIAEALNEGWKADYSSGSSQLKYGPVFVWTGSGFAFSYTHTSNWYADTSVGSRLVYRNLKLAEYAGTKFIDKYNKFLHR